jgi:hypothetical protein
MKSFYAEKMGHLKARYQAEYTTSIHSTSSYPFDPIDQFLDRFKFIYVTVVFRTEKKSTNFKTVCAVSNLLLEYGRNASFGFITKFNIASPDRSSMA